MTQDNPSSEAEKSKDRTVKILLFLLLALFYFEFITFKKTFYSYDTITTYVPMRMYGYEQLKTGKLPLWANEIGSGYPLLAEGQGSFFYPPNFLFMFLPWDVALNSLILLHCFLASLFMYLYAREINLSRQAAFLSAVVFAYNGFSTSRFQHFVILQVGVWLPLTFYFIEKIRKEKNLVTFSILGAISALQSLAFFPQMFLYCFLVSAAYAFVRLSDVKLISLFVLSSAAGLLLSGVQLLPTLELVEHSVRAKGIVSAQETIRDALSWKHVPHLFLPDFSLRQSAVEKFKTIEMQGYVGIIAAVLALLSLFKNKKKEILFFAILIPAAFCLSFGSGNILSRAVLLLPVFRYFAAPVRFLFFFAFGVSILAGFGLDSLRLKKTHGILILLLVIIDLYVFSVSKNLIKTDAEKFYNLPVNLTQFLKQDKSLYRIFWNKGFPELAPNVNLIHGIQSVNLHTPLFINRYWELMQLYLEGKNEKILNLLNVKYIFHENNSIVLNKQVMPRAFVVHQTRFLKNKSDILKALASDTFNPEHEVILEGKQKNMNSPSGANFSPVEILNYSPDEISIEANLKHEGYLVLSDTYYPGWKASVDGKETKIYIGNYALRAIHLGKGNHKIQFYYRPASFKAGILVSLSGVLILLASFTLARSKKFALRL